MKPTASDMVCEITVTVKNEEKNLKKKHLIYDDFKVDEDDPLIHSLLREAEKEFNDEITSAKVRINLEVVKPHKERDVGI